MDYQKLADYRNTHNAFAARLGIRVEEIRAGYARTRKTVGPEDLNPGASAHGGCFFSMADTACGSAVAARGFLAVTVSADYHFLLGAKAGDVLTAEARAVREGRTLCVYAVDLRNQDGTSLGTGTFTFRCLPDQPIALP